MRHLKATVAYDGTGFHGWQIQPHQPTIQGALQSVLTGIDGQPIAVHGAGRTDAGVHALGQVASFRLSNPIPAPNLRRVMNHRLPDSIRILTVEEAAPDFHPRFDATSKTYEYRIWREEVCPPAISRYVYPHPYPLDESAMIDAAPLFEGTHDFLSLAAAGGAGKQSTERTIFTSQLERRDSLLIYRVCGTGFLYRMVRNMVGVLLAVGGGNRSPNDIPGILAARKRSAAAATPPARGLFLVCVEYGKKDGQRCDSERRGASATLAPSQPGENP